MPYIKVSGIPDRFGIPEQALDKLSEKVIDATLAIPELNIPKRSHVNVYFPMDLLGSKESRNIFVEVELFDKPERTQAVRNSLAMSIATALKEEFPNNKVRCKCRLIDETDGWAAV